IMVMADLLHEGRVRADGGPRRLDVLQILAAGGVGPVRACDKRQRPAYALVAHGRELVGEERMPVPVAPEHWQVQTRPVKLGPQRGEQAAALLVDGRDATEVPVVLRHGREPLFGHVTAAYDVAQERHYVVRAFRAAEGDQDYRVVPHERHLTVLAARHTLAG